MSLWSLCARLLLLEGGPGSPSCLLGGKHSVSWGFEDMLPTLDITAGAAENKGKGRKSVYVFICMHVYEASEPVSN